MKLKRIAGLTLIAILVCCVFAGCGQEKKAQFPEKDMKIIVPWPAGGATDLLARVIAAEAEKKIGRSVVVENKAGGGGAVGHDDGSKAKPDGYTVTLMTTEASTAHLLGLAKFSYNDFAPILLIATSPAALAVNQESPYQSLNDFIKAAKNKPGSVKVASLAAGGIWNLAAVGMEKKASVDFNIVPYAGGAPSITAALGGHVDGVSAGFSEVLPYVQDKKLRILGVSSDQRQAAYNQAPTFKEQGIPLAMGAWWGIGVPKNTPDDLKESLHKIFKEAINSEKVQEVLKTRGFEFNYKGPQDFSKWLEEMNKEFSLIIKE